MLERTPPSGIPRHKGHVRFSSWLAAIAVVASTLGLMPFTASPAAAQRNCTPITSPQTMTVELNYGKGKDGRLIRNSWHQMSQINIKYQGCFTGSKPGRFELNQVYWPTHYMHDISVRNNEWRLNKTGSRHVAWLSSLKTGELQINMSECIRSNEPELRKLAVDLLPLPGKQTVGNVAKAFVGRTPFFDEAETMCLPPTVHSIDMIMNDRGFFERRVDRQVKRYRQGGDDMIEIIVTPTSYGIHNNGEQRRLVSHLSQSQVNQSGAWLIDGSRGRRFVDPRCAKNLNYRRVSFDYLKGYTDLTNHPDNRIRKLYAWTPCDYVTEHLNKASLRNSPRLFTMNGVSSPHGYLIYQGESQWLTGDCMKQLAIGGNTNVTGVTNQMIKIYPDRATGRNGAKDWSKYRTCAQVQLLLRPLRGGPALVTAPGVSTDQAWVIIDNKAHWVGHECYFKLSFRTGIPVETIPWDAFKPGRKSHVGFNGTCEQLKTRLKRSNR